MPATINPIRKALLKKSLLKGKSVRQSMKDAGYTQLTADRSTMNKSAKICMKEVEKAINLKDLANKAYKTLENSLNAPKTSDKNTAAVGLLKYTVGEKLQQTATIEVSEKEKVELGRYRSALLPARSDN